jgi:hypothetical protein
MMGTHKLKPQRWGRVVWTLGGKINQSFRNFLNSRYIYEQFSFEGRTAEDSLSKKMWSPKIFTAIMMSVSSLGLYMTPSGAAVLAIQPSQLAWNRPPRKLKRENKMKRYY